MSNELDQFKAFLEDLSDLTRKTGVIVGGCGCCASPYLYTQASVPPDGNLQDIKWDPESESYNHGWYPTSDNVHILKTGQALCGKNKTPSEWEEGHSWVSYQNVDPDLAEVFCEDCYMIWLDT